MNILRRPIGKGTRKATTLATKLHPTPSIPSKTLQSRTKRTLYHRVNTTSPQDQQSIMENLPHLDPITRLSPTVTRILGHNPSKFTLQGTNTYLIGTGSTRLLLDTGEGKPEWLSSIKQALKTAGPDVRISDIILTHWHPDHVGGVRDILSLPGHENAKVWKNSPDSDAGQHPIPSNKVFHTFGATLTAHHTPGHTTDHMCFLLHEENALFTGDNVLGHGTAVFEDLPTYMQSLEKMAAVEGFSGRAYPAHGDVIEDGVGRVREYISHRQQREEQILRVLEGNGGELGSMEIVKVVYKDYPESLWAPAEGGVKQVLRKLEGDGRVVEVSKGSGKWRLSGKAAL